MYLSKNGPVGTEGLKTLGRCEFNSKISSVKHSSIIFEQTFHNYSDGFEMLDRGGWLKSCSGPVFSIFILAITWPFVI